MQTFLPYGSFEDCALILDDKRLCKQRLEAYQILRTLLGITTGWANHPIVRMWKGHEECLRQYALTMCDEWVARGFEDNLHFDILALKIPYTSSRDLPDIVDEKFLEGHRKILYHKDPIHYGRFEDDETAAPYRSSN